MQTRSQNSHRDFTVELCIGPLSSICRGGEHERVRERFRVLEEKICGAEKGNNANK